jgi:hypothetical protein
MNRFTSYDIARRNIREWDEFVLASSLEKYAKAVLQHREKKPMD